VHDAAGRRIALNDNWAEADATVVRVAASRAGAFPLTEGGRDAAVIAQLDPGAYTVTASAATGAGGLVLVEVYELP
jgi:hypothetical protein